MKNLTEQQFNRRISALKTCLEQTADTHGKLMDDLRIVSSVAWTEEETRDEERHRSALSFKY